MRLWLSQIVLFCLLAIARGKKNITCGIHCNGYYGTRDLCVNSADQSPQLIKNCNFTSRSQKKKKKSIDRVLNYQYHNTCMHDFTPAREFLFNNKMSPYCSSIQTLHTRIFASRGSEKKKTLGHKGD